MSAVLYETNDRAPGAEGAAVLAAAVVIVVGQSASEGVTYALSADPAKLSAASAQMLNLLANDLVVTSAIGLLSFGLAAESRSSAASDCRHGSAALRA